MTKAAAPPTPLLWAADMELQTHANLGTRTGSYASQENRCPSHHPQHLIHLQPPVVRPSCSKDESPVFSHTPVPGTVPKPLSSPSHPHSITGYHFPPSAPFVPRSEHLERPCLTQQGPSKFLLIDHRDTRNWPMESLI